MKKLAYLLVIIPLLWGCERSDGAGYQGELNLEHTPEKGIVVDFAENKTLEPITQRQISPRESKEIHQPDKKLIKQGEMTIEVNALKSSKKKMDEMVKAVGGYYDNENYQEHYSSLDYELKIRVPVNQFEKLVSSLEGGFDKILNKSISTVDVTSRYIDLESRLASKRASLDRYRAILKSAKTIKEILEVEEYIRKIEEEIESTMVQLKQLNGQTSYSTLSVSLTQPVEVEVVIEEGPGFWTKAGNSVVGGWNSLESFVLVLLRVWPFLILIVGLVLTIKWFRGK